MGIIQTSLRQKQYLERTISRMQSMLLRLTTFAQRIIAFLSAVKRYITT